jgi:hypothetical protein
MKYEVEIRGRQVTIEFEQRNGRMQARVGSRDYDLEVVSPEAGVYTFIDGDRIYEARVWAREPNSLSVTISGLVFNYVINRKHVAQP